MKSLPKMLLVLTGAAAAMALTGCIERRITILSNPDGARLQVNGQEMPRTPCTFSFEWYGDYDIILRYEKEEKDAEGKAIRRVYYLHTHQKTVAPAHQTLGFDLLTDLIPTKVVDHQTFTFQIPEITAPSPADLVDHALDAKNRNDLPTGVKRAE